MTIFPATGRPLAPHSAPATERPRPLGAFLFRTASDDPPAERSRLEWRSPVSVLADYLDAVGVDDAGVRARSLLAEFGSLSDLLAASDWRLRWILGRRLAHVVRTSRELMKARLAEQVGEGPLVHRSRELIDLLQLEVGFLEHERLLALFVDCSSRLIRIETIGDGTVGHVAIDARKIIGCGLAIGASAFILVHNHPSGDPAPSQSDITATARLRALGEQVDLTLLDHLIVARGRFGSIEDFWRESQWGQSPARD